MKVVFEFIKSENGVSSLSIPADRIVAKNGFIVALSQGNIVAIADEKNVKVCFLILENVDIETI